MINFKKIVNIIALILATFTISISFAGCAFNECDWDGCHNSKVENGEYCKLHTCALDSCFQSSINSTYCLLHGCHYWKCDNLTVPYYITPDGQYELYSRYCEEHTCQKEDCYNQKDTFSNYCKEHK